MWVGDDQEEAWAKCRWAPAACANHIEDTMKRNPEHGMPDTMTRLVQARDDYDYYAGHLDSAAEHTEYLTGELVDDFALAGTPEKVRARARELAELGVDEISCAYLNGAFDQMALVGREIIPALAKAARLSGSPPTSARPTSATARGATPVLHPMFIVSRKTACIARAP